MGRRYLAGKYALQNPMKHIKVKGRRLVEVKYKSSLERRAFYWLDTNAAVIEWGYETEYIPYIGIDGKKHRYEMDIYASIQDRHGKITKYFIEIKPFAKTSPPTVSNKKKATTKLYEANEWGTNLAKWNFTKEYCKSRGIEFMIMTEQNNKYSISDFISKEGFRIAMVL